jgi:hypothetical protein
MNIETTIQQIGGNKALFMMGCKQIVSDEANNAITLRIKGSKVKYVKITLNSMDTYDLSFYSGRLMNLKERAVEGIYNDMMKETIERETGLYLSL